MKQAAKARLHTPKLEAENAERAQAVSSQDPVDMRIASGVHMIVEEPNAFSDFGFRFTNAQSNTNES